MDDTQLSLAIGKKGPKRPPGRQASGVAHRYQERGGEAAGNRDRRWPPWPGAAHPFRELTGLGREDHREACGSTASERVEQLAQMTPEELMQIQGVGEKTVERIRKVVTDYFERGQSAEAGGEETAPAESAAAVQATEAEADAAGGFRPGRRNP